METYISIDVETTGKVPGLCHMLELGAAAIIETRGHGTCIQYFTGSLRLEHGDYHVGDTCEELDCEKAGWDNETWKWWHDGAEREKTLADIYRDMVPAVNVMREFADWMKQFRQPVIVGYPVAWDFSFLHYYWWKYIGTMPPFSHSARDMKTMIADYIGCDYREATKKRLQEYAPDLFTPDLPHTHRALDDAKEQAYIFAGLMKRVKRLRDFRTDVSTTLSLSGPDNGNVEIEQIKWLMERLTKFETRHREQCDNAACSLCVDLIEKEYLKKRKEETV